MRFMNRRALSIGVAILVLAIAGGVLIHALRSGRPAQAEPETAPAVAHQPPRDSLGDNLFPPELIMQFQSQIGLSDDQRQAIMSEMQKVQPKLEELHQRLQKERAALTPLLAQGRVDPEPALAQADKVQGVEQEIRRAHLALLIAMKNRLTPEQQARLQEIKPPPPPDRASGPQPPQSILDKMQQLQAGVQRWQQAGQDASAVVQTMQRFEPLLRSGQFKQAEAVLDEALALLEQKKER
jgi:Spy/CpxP family protein refolding chaperone